MAHDDEVTGLSRRERGGPLSARAWMVTLPYWLIILLGLPMPLLWLRFTRHRRDAPVP